jgi:hypothetical protein
MPPLERAYELYPGILGDVIRVRFRKFRGNIQMFTVQLELLIDGEHVPAVRWDTAHGIAHRDHLHRDGTTDHWDRTSGSDDFDTAFTEAIADVIENWERYRSDFLRRESKR